jgi:hypothetical protein
MVENEQQPRSVDYWIGRHTSLEERVSRLETDINARLVNLEKMLHELNQQMAGHKVQLALIVSVSSFGAMLAANYVMGRH